MCVGGVLVLLGGAFLPQSKQVNAQNTDERVFDTVICRELRVVDAFGQVRARLGSDDDGGFVVVWGKDKKRGAFLDGGGLTIANNEGKIVGMLQATEYSGGLTIFNNEGHPVGTLDVSNTGGGVLFTRDKHGNITGRVP